MEAQADNPNAIDAEIAREFGDTEVRTLRNMYSKGFAPSFPESTKLHQLIGRTDEALLAPFRRHYADGSLARRIREAGG